jgi:hypothetical protein
MDLLLVLILATAVTVALIRGTVESHPHTDYFMTCLN